MHPRYIISRLCNVSGPIRKLCIWGKEIMYLGCTIRGPTILLSSIKVIVMSICLYMCCTWSWQCLNLVFNLASMHTCLMGWSGHKVFHQKEIPLSVLNYKCINSGFQGLWGKWKMCFFFSFFLHMGGLHGIWATDESKWNLPSGFKPFLSFN